MDYFEEEILNFEKRVSESHKKKYDEFERLSQESPKIVEKGDKVLVAVGLLGHGFEWIRESCEVVDVKGNHSKVKWFDKHKMVNKDDGHVDFGDVWEYWIPNALIVEILK